MDEKKSNFIWVFCSEHFRLPKKYIKSEIQNLCNIGLRDTDRKRKSKKKKKIEKECNKIHLFTLSQSPKQDREIETEYNKNIT